MKVTFKRNMSCNYAVLQVENRLKDDYQTHILLENQVPGLLPCKLQRIDGKEYLYYDITGSQSLGNLYEKGKFNQQILKELFLEVVNILEKLDEYLMNRDFLLLDPMYVYKNLDNNAYSFFWFPEQENTIEQEFCCLTEYILPKINHQDKRAVAIGYGMHKFAVESRIQPDCLRRLIYEEKEEKEVFSESKKKEEEQERQKILDDFYKEEDETESPLKKIIIIGVFLIIGILVFFVRYLSAMGIRYIGIAATMLVILIIALAVLGYMIKYRKSDLHEDILQASGKSEKLEKSEKSEYDDEQEEIGKTVLLQQEIKEQSYLLEIDSGKKYFLEKESNLIGSQRELTDIYLHVPTISRLHAKIIYKNNQVFLIDLNSRNGTELDGEVLQPEKEYLLKEENVIAFAEKRYMYIDKYNATFGKIW